MKKILAVAAAAVLALALTACSSQAPKDDDEGAAPAPAADTAAKEDSAANGQQQAQQPANNGQQAANNGQQQAQQDSSAASTAAPAGPVSPDDAKEAAIAALGLGLPEQVQVEYVDGAAPYYVVTCSWGTEAHNVTVDAMSGKVTDDGYAPAEAAASYISPDDAKEAAISFLGLGLPETVTADLVDGASPYYLVVCSWGTEAHNVTVDAVTGAVLQ